MEVINQKTCAQVHGGNVIIPMLASLSIGACGGLLSWALKTAYRGETEEFNSMTNYFVEGTIGAAIAGLATISFVFAA